MPNCNQGALGGSFEGLTFSFYTGTISLLRLVDHAYNSIIFTCGNAGLGKLGVVVVVVVLVVVVVGSDYNLS